MDRRRKVVITAVFILAFTGMGSLLLATRQGIGISPDSVVYIGAARNLADGAGLTVPFGGAPGAANPMVSRAPFYAILIAGSGLAGIDPLAGARWINAFLFGANILLAGFLSFYLTRGAVWTAVFAAFLLMTSLTMLTIHAYAWSEAVFILLGFGGLFLLSRYLADGRFLWLLLAAVCIGLANFTRYAGLPFIAVSGLGILLFAKRPWLRRLAHTAVFGILAALPLGLWFYRNTRVAGSAASRDLVFHPIGRRHIIQAVDTLAGWLLIPPVFPGVIKIGAIALLAGLVLLIAWLARKQKQNNNVKDGPWYLSRLLALFILVYPAFLAVSISFLDANTPLDERILAPVFVAGIWLVVYNVQILLNASHGRRLIAIGVTAVALLFGVLYLLNAASWVRVSQGQGLGFSNRVWQDTEIEQAINQLPADAVIYSNAPGIVYILTERPSTPLPKNTLAVTQQINSKYDQELAEVKIRLVDDNNYVVYFGGVGQAISHREQAFVEQLSLQALTSVKEGTIYVYAPD
ncbi:MAG TPA: hypothetical protein EYP41_18100 [Anaerolineae bacterium]|nr:hypothetical protein [Anaerolineae bacterium]HIP70221.1 hypothetical protein [Anaerolineae bacterium]